MDKQIVELYGPDQIARRVSELAGEISEAYSGGELTVLGVLEDSFVFLADLLRSLEVPVRTSFLRYNHQSRGGANDLTFTTDIALAGRDVLLVEGVLETGVPQEYLMKHLGGQGARRVRLCVLADKASARRTELRPDRRALETEEDYVAGYGIGFQERWREPHDMAASARG